MKFFDYWIWVSCALTFVRRLLTELFHVKIAFRTSNQKISTLYFVPVLIIPRTINFMFTRCWCFWWLNETIALNFSSFIEPRDACAKKQCSNYATCQVQPDGVTAKCVCSEICPTKKDPVCGVNGETYENECQLRAASCKTSQPISVASKGECGMYFSNCFQFCKLWKIKNGDSDIV